VQFLKGYCFGHFYTFLGTSLKDYCANTHVLIKGQNFNKRKKEFLPSLCCLSRSSLSRRSFSGSPFSPYPHKRLNQVMPMLAKFTTKLIWLVRLGNLVKCLLTGFKNRISKTAPQQGCSVKLVWGDLPLRWSILP